MTSPSLFSPGCKFICQMKTLYSNGSISELISQSLPFQGKRFPAMFDLQNITDLRWQIHQDATTGVCLDLHRVNSSISSFHSFNIEFLNKDYLLVLSNWNFSPAKGELFHISLGQERVPNIEVCEASLEILLVMTGQFNTVVLTFNQEVLFFSKSSIVFSQS